MCMMQRIDYQTWSSHLIKVNGWKRNGWDWQQCAIELRVKFELINCSDHLCGAALTCAYHEPVDLISDVTWNRSYSRLSALIPPSLLQHGPVQILLSAVLPDGSYGGSCRNGKPPDSKNAVRKSEKIPGKSCTPWVMLSEPSVMVAKRHVTHTFGFWLKFWEESFHFIKSLHKTILSWN